MSVATSHGLGDRMAALQGPALWTITGLVLYVLGGTASLLGIALFESVFLAPMGLDPQAGTLGLSVQNGVHALVWGLLTAALSVPLGRRLVAGIRFPATGWLVLLIGLAIATGATLLGNEFVRARFGYYDPEYEGLTLFTGPALVALALATWAALAVPRDGVLIPGAAALTAAAGLALTLLPSLPGAADGIPAESIPLVAMFALGAVYGAVAGILVVRRAFVPRGR